MANVKTKLKCLQISRIVIQLAFFIFMPSLFSQAFAGVKEAAALMGKGQPLKVSDFAVKLLILCTITVIFGRIFCGFMCSFGAIGDWFYMLSEFIQKKTGIKFPKISEKYQIIMQKFKYIILLLIVVICFVGNGEYITKYSPWTVFSLVTQRNFKIGAYATGIFLLILIIIGMMLKERFFCQFLCPLGAVFSLLPKIPLFHVKKKGQQCFNGCKACTNKCPVNLKYDEAGMREGECISCGRCFMVCPHRMKKNTAAKS